MEDKMKTAALKFASVLVMILILYSCATVFKGYDDRVLLKNAPDKLEVYDLDGVKIPILPKTVNAPMKSQTGDLIVQTDRFYQEYYIDLRSDQPHTLVLKYDGKEKLVRVYPKIGFWWGVLDFFTGGLPVFIDAYTGAWNHFDDIDAGF